MKSCKLKHLRNVLILYKGKLTEVDIYKCEKCNKYCIIDTNTDAKISLNNELGDEI